MPVEPTWLDADFVIKVNRAEVTETGEPHRLRDRGLLEGALNRPRNLWAYEDVVHVPRLAAALVAGIARAHPFIQGNKRTAQTAGIVFAALNGYEWTGADIESIGHWLTALVRRDITEEDYAALLATYLNGDS